MCAPLYELMVLYQERDVIVLVKRIGSSLNYGGFPPTNNKPALGAG